MDATVDRPHCPACGAADALPIVYGRPDPEMVAQSERGEVWLGGCLIDDDSPSHRCGACGTEFGAAGFFS